MINQTKENNYLPHVINFIGNFNGLVTNHHVRRRGDTTILCDNKLIKLDNEFHHCITNITSLVIISLDDQGKYLCLNEKNIPVSIDYIQIAGVFVVVCACVRACVRACVCGVCLVCAHARVCVSHDVHVVIVHRL